MKHKKKTVLPTLPAGERKHNLWRYQGIFKGEGTVVYTISFPEDSNKEFWNELGGHLLSFWEKESKSPCDGVRFGGLEVKKEGDSLLLLYAFCPFEKKEFRPVARLFFDEDGKLCRIKKIKSKA